MFELVFLGTAAAVPSAERGLPALLVGHGPDRFLVDCGEGTQRQLLRAGLGFRGLRHVLLTHAHLDHVVGLAGLVATRALWGLSGAIEIIGSGETVEFVRQYLAVTVGAENPAISCVRCHPAWCCRCRACASTLLRWRIEAPRASVTGSRRKRAAPCLPNGLRRWAFRTDQRGGSWREAAR